MFRFGQSRSLTRFELNGQVLQDLSPFREVAPDLAQLRGELLQQGGHGQNLILSGQVRILGHVDDPELVPPFMMFFTDLFEVLDGVPRSQGISGDEEPRGKQGPEPSPPGSSPLRISRAEWSSSLAGDFSLSHAMLVPLPGCILFADAWKFFRSFPGQCLVIFHFSPERNIQKSLYGKKQEAMIHENKTLARFFFLKKKRTSDLSCSRCRSGETYAWLCKDSIKPTIHARQVTSAQDSWETAHANRNDIQRPGLFEESFPERPAAGCRRALAFFSGYGRTSPPHGPENFPGSSPDADSSHEQWQCAFGACTLVTFHLCLV